MSKLYFSEIEDTSPFWRWYSNNIGQSLIEKTFTEEHWKLGGSHHLVDKYSKCRDKLDFWFSLDKKNQQLIFQKYDEYQESEKKRLKRERDEEYYLKFQFENQTSDSD
jgi:hypothetical protein